MGLGKFRTPLGEWINGSPYNQIDFSLKSGVSRKTITVACSDKDWIPSANVIKKIMKTVKEIDPEMRASDFWDI